MGRTAAMITLPYRQTGVAVLGANYWGSHILRILHDLTDSIYVVDPDVKVRSIIRKTYPTCKIYPLADKLWSNPNIHAVFIATPSARHYALAKLALEAGKHVFVEKPITLSSAHALHLITLQKRFGTVLMVDHTYLYSNALATLKKHVGKGTIGRVRGIESIRVGPGIIRTDTSVLWDLAPHDISIGMFLTGKKPTHGKITSAQSFPHALAHTALISMKFGHIPMSAFLSWTSPTKMRQLSVFGTKGALAILWDGPHEALFLYPLPTHSRPFEHGTRIKTHRGEPLAGAIRHFLDCVLTNSKPLTDGIHGYSVVQTIEQLTETAHP